jgi:polyisoprenoid-binding protein YceI
MINLFISVFLTCLPLFSAWQVSSSNISFKVKHGVGGTADGTLKGLVASIEFDESKPEKTMIKATVLTNTISTGLGIRDNAIKKEEYLDVEHYPTIALVISGASSIGNGKYRTLGLLNIKGKEQKLPLTFSFNRSSGQFGSKFKINRTDFGVGKSTWLLADTLEVSISALATR